ncbi:asparaginyl-tRNA synthetase [Lecanora helva]
MVNWCTSVEISGVWRPAPPGKEQTYELQAKDVRIVGTVDAEKYPIQKKYHSAEYLRSLPHLRLRTPLNALLARMRSDSDFYLASFFRDQHFVRVQAPIITSSDCEGAGEVFTVSSNKPSPDLSSDDETSPRTENDFFKEPKYLTVSSQLHLEAFVHEHQGVWTLSPTFRAEKSDTPRHVSEFWMLEVEMRTENLQIIMDLVEQLIQSLIGDLQGRGVVKELVSAHRGGGNLGRDESSELLELLTRRWQGLLQPSWPRITYQDAMRHLQNATQMKKASFQYKPSWSNGLQLEHERYIATTVGQGKPVFVTDYPRDMKPFYMLPSFPSYSDNDPAFGTAACFDLLLPEVCEVVGGSLREHRLESLIRNMESRGLKIPGSRDSTTEQDGTGTPASPHNLDWYLDLRRYGSVPHGGFGLGFDRLLSYLAGINNIKDAVPWPRYYGRCDC